MTRRAVAPYLLLIPSVGFMLVLFGWPVIAGVLQSFGYGGDPGVTMTYWRRMADEAARSCQVSRKPSTATSPTQKSRPKNVRANCGKGAMEIQLIC